tara:strand:+ start:131 stop:841 length:711 start_codon:yes stop_codon:yes gene_type:complete
MDQDEIFPFELNDAAATQTHSAPHDFLGGLLEDALSADFFDETPRDGCAHNNEFSEFSEFGDLGELGELGEFSEISELSELSELNELNELSELNEMLCGPDNPPKRLEGSSSLDMSACQKKSQYDSDSDAKVFPLNDDETSSSSDDASSDTSSDADSAPKSSPIMITRKRSSNIEVAFLPSSPPASPAITLATEGKVDWSKHSFLTRNKQCLLNQVFMNSQGPDFERVQRICQVLA